MIKVTIINETNLLEKTLSQLPELSGFDFITKKEIPLSDFQCLIISEDTSPTQPPTNSLILHRPIDVNLVINHLLNFFKDQDHKLDSISFNFRKRIFFNETKIIDLTEIESALFKNIIHSYKMSISKHKLIHDVLGYSKEAETKTLENHLYKLKAKLKELGVEYLLHIEGDNISIKLNS